MSVAETPVQYMERTRQYYRALGYDNDYVWARPVRRILTA